MLSVMHNTYISSLYGIKYCDAFSYIQSNTCVTFNVVNHSEDKLVFAITYVIEGLDHRSITSLFCSLS